MNKSFVLQFKEEFSFLTKYGFVFAKDPLNPNRPCYKNKYGEIVMWYNYHGKIGTPYEIYVQLNGQKKIINLNQEYKKHMNQPISSKSQFKIFRELFEYVVSSNSYFYGLNISHEKIEHDEMSDLEELLEYETQYNVNEIIKKERKFKIILPISILIYFIQTVIFFIINPYFSDTFNLILHNILYFLILLFCIGFLLFMSLKLLSKLLIIAYPLILLLTLNLCDNRINYIIYILSLLVTFVYFVYTIVVGLIKKDKKYWINGLIPIIYPLIVLLNKSRMLDEYVFAMDINTPNIIIPGIIIIAVILLIVIFLKKIKRKLANFIVYFYLSVTVFILMFVILPKHVIKTCNYAFDKSPDVRSRYQIVSTYSRTPDDYIKTTIYYNVTMKDYYMVIRKDLKNHELKVNYILYFFYDEYDYISFYKHEGALNYTYYEYKYEHLPIDD